MSPNSFVKIRNCREARKWTSNPAKNPTLLSEITKENYTSLVCCPYCGNRYSYVKCGFYSRYLFDDDLTASTKESTRITASDYSTFAFTAIFLTNNFTLSGLYRSIYYIP